MANETKMFVPIEALYDYCNSRKWNSYCELFVSRLYNYKGKKFNYKKAVKHLHKAASLMPLELTIEVKVDLERRSNAE
jgi:hypothetical protein